MSPTYLAPDDIQDYGDVDILDRRLQSRNQLMQIFLEQVDPILPFLHFPSLCDHFINGRPYLDYGADHPAPRALVSAVSYIAISSIGDDRCIRTFGTQRQLLLAKHHKNTQSALEMADYINTNDLTVLQAFVLFLFSIRTHDQSRRAWTMLSLALRIAQSIFLQKSDPPFPVKPLEREMRRRLWHAIAFLDVQASFDCGSEPMLPSSCLTSQVFRNVDDAELFSPQCHDPSRQMPQGSYADTRFIMIIAEAQHAFRTLDLPDLTEISTTVLDINIRQHAATTFRQKALTLLAGYQPETIQFHWFVKKLVEIIHAFLKLAAFRPLRRTSHFSAPSVPRGGLLLLTIKFLHALDQFNRDRRSEPFRWFIRLFVPWHALTVAIDEVCTCEDKLLQQNCRPLIERSLSSFQEQLTDVHRAMLLKPVDRFMTLAQPSMEIPSPNNDYLAVDMSSISMGTDEAYLC